ncbi:MAG: SDR family NAD(P)-dependent oxidoreductase [Deltaproteobacteria bacterium]|nr:SDR family NAD(P)-dependent oxidoreductase [Deltaproteobacteria bacterium]
MVPSGIGLAGKTVLLTGAASGLGRRLAIDLRRRYSCTLHLVDRNEPGLLSLRDELRKIDEEHGEERCVDVHRIDISSDAEVRRLANELEGIAVDLLINNAGVLYAGTFAGMPSGTFEHLIDVNLMGTVRMTREFLPHVMRGRDPCVVNVASAAGMVGAPGMCAYSTSKFGIVGFSEALRTELAGRVSVLTVCPTLVRTNIVQSAGHADVDGDATRPMEAVMQRRGMDVEHASRLLLRGIERRRPMIFIGADARILDWMRRLSPGLTARLVRAGYGYLQRRRILPP